MRRINFAILAGIIVLGSAYAQVGGPPPPDGPPPGAPPHAGPGRGPFMHPWKVVTGAPYSATATDQFSQTLADGNTIQRTTTEQIARDSQGRTYTQQTLTGGPWASEGGSKKVIFLDDPVSGYQYVLHPDKKLAIRRHIRMPAQGEGPGSDFEHKRHPGSPFQKNSTETDLGSKDIPGAGIAQGKSITHTIPAGQIGNAQPITSTGETWYSPDLQIIVLSKRSDPRTGQSTYSLTNIQRSEPNSPLFQVPSDYKIQDASTTHWHPGPPE
jgi:hypothetical protein